MPLYMYAVSRNYHYFHNYMKKRVFSNYNTKKLFCVAFSFTRVLKLNNPVSLLGSLKTCLLCLLLTIFIWKQFVLKKIALPVHVQACYKFHSNSNEMFEDALCTLGNNWDKNKGIKILILILTWLKKKTSECLIAILPRTN